MYTIADQLTKLTLTKNLITDQTFTNITCRNNSAGEVFNSDGLCATTSTTTIWVVHMGGWNDQRMTATMKWTSPTTAGNEEIGVLFRFQTVEASGDTTYYYARVDGGVAKLTKVVAGTFTNLATQSWSLAINTYCTITASAVGNAISATFSASGGSPADITLSATDSAIPSGGLMGFRSLTSTIAVSSFTAEQL